MSETETVNIIDKEKYDSIVAMLISSDKESHTLALVMLNEMSQSKENLAAILLLKKAGENSITEEEWTENAKDLMSTLEVYKIEAATRLHYQRIYDIIIAEEVDRRQVEFYMNQFVGTWFVSDMKDRGYNMIESMEVIFKWTDEDTGNTKEEVSEQPADEGTSSGESDEKSNS